MQIFNKLLLLLEYFGDNLGREHVLPVLSVFGTIGFIVAIGYLLAYLVRIEEEDIQKKQSTKNNNNNGKSISYTTIVRSDFLGFSFLCLLIFRRFPFVIALISMLMCFVVFGGRVCHVCALLGAMSYAIGIVPNNARQNAEGERA